MALPTVTEINNAIDDIYAALSTDKTKVGSRYAVGLLQKMRVPLLEAYRSKVDITIVDLQDDSLEGLIGGAIGAAVQDEDFVVTDAQDQGLWDLFNLSEDKVGDDDLTVTDDADSNLKGFFDAVGELGVGLSAAAVVGDVFQVAGTGDTVDDALEAAKGSAPANGDFFIVENVDAGSEAVVYVGLDISADGEFAEQTDLIAAVGDTYRVGGTGDTVDNALEAAKGSAVADNDLFIVTGSSLLTAGANTLSYLGNAAILAGQLSETGGFGRAPIVGDVFQVTGTGDTTDNALETAKGSAVADGDMFKITNVTPGSVAITYIGLNVVLLPAFADEEIADFVNL